MAMRKRSGSGSKRQLKEKVVQFYESFFRGEDVTESTTTWDEFFLLKPNVAQLEAEVSRLTVEQLSALRPHISLLFTKCVDIIRRPPDMRVVYAMQTLCALLSSLHKRVAAEGAADLCDYLLDQHNHHCVDELLVQCKTLLSGEEVRGVVWWVLRLLLTLVQTESRSLITRLLQCPLLETLMQLLAVSADRQHHGEDVVVLLTLLITYDTEEAPNPYTRQFSSLDDECALNGFALVITRSLSDSVSRAPQETSAGGLLSSLKGFLFSQDEVPHARGGEEIMLLALHQAAYLNKNFMMTLTHSTASTQPSPACTLVTQQLPPNEALMQALESDQPTNLCVTLFYYCSVLMANLKSEWNAVKLRACFSTLLVFTGNQLANNTLHDHNLTFKVQLHRSPMRHRKIAPGEPDSQTLAATLLDLLVEFILCHLERRFPSDLYALCVAVVEQLLVYQKSWKVRLAYDWKALWNALIVLLDFLQKNDSLLLKKHNNFTLALQVVNILNVFITAGDEFLPNPAVYDQLYYELLRQKNVFQDLSAVALRYSTCESGHKAEALRLANALTNIKAIINHFSPKIRAWLHHNNVSTPLEKDIVDIILKGYGNLVLKKLSDDGKFNKTGLGENTLRALRREASARARESLSTQHNTHTDALLQHYSAIERS